jgi:hypothetical protein
MAKIPNQLDNRKIIGIQQGTVDFFGKVARDLHLQNGSNATGWLNTIQQLNDIAVADNLRSLKLEDTDTIRYTADDIISKSRGNVVNVVSIESYLGSIPSNFSTANGIIENSYTVFLPEKKFYSNVLGFQSNVNNLSTYVNSTLNTNNVYINSNVTTSLDYSVNNGYIADWVTLSAKNFDLTAVTQGVQDISELNIAHKKSAFLNNKFLG